MSLSFLLLISSKIIKHLDHFLSKQIKMKKKKLKNRIKINLNYNNLQCQIQFLVEVFVLKLP